MVRARQHIFAALGKVLLSFSSAAVNIDSITCTRGQGGSNGTTHRCLKHSLCLFPTFSVFLYNADASPPDRLRRLITHSNSFIKFSLIELNVFIQKNSFEWVTNLCKQLGAKACICVVYAYKNTDIIESKCKLRSRPQDVTLSFASPLLG